MTEKVEVDIREFSFDEFVQYFFERVPPIDMLKEEPWYWSEEVIFEPQTVCDHYFRLFRQPGSLLKRFSKGQLDQGFWAIQAPNLECSVYHLMWDGGLPFLSREMLVRAMFDLYKGLFAIGPLDQSSAMWWDSLCYDWHCGNRKRERGERIC
jgi:hypothetical protein